MRNVKRMLQVGTLVTVFAVGYLCGSATQRNANADMKDLGGAALKEAAGSQGGSLGSAAKLGTTIVDMQAQVDGLNKNLTVLKSIQSALGG
jgi:hypothetical protein